MLRRGTSVRDKHKSVIVTAVPEGEAAVAGISRGRSSRELTKPPEPPSERGFVSSETPSSYLRPTANEVLSVHPPLVAAATALLQGFCQLGRALKPRVAL